MRYKIKCCDVFEFLKERKKKSISLLFTSPPYNIGKEYEKDLALREYISWQKRVIEKCDSLMTDTGSFCWQVGSYVNKGSIVPLDILLYPIFLNLGWTLRNRVIWTFNSGLHCTHRLSGRYETILWFTRDGYTFNLDPIRVPQKYPNKKSYKGANAGKLSCNPLGKNPGDVWEISNVKHNHPEKTAHPCQFPEEIVKRFILSTTNKNDIVLDPFMGSGTTVVTALKLNRRALGCDKETKYFDIAKNRIERIIHMNE